MTRQSGSPGCDHYHAVPMSDGFHVLFVDPATNQLTMGCDAPLGGPAKLLRKIVLVSPEGRGTPRIYHAAADMSHGTLVVVAFEDTIVLYTIPVDVVTFSRSQQRADGDGASSATASLSEQRPRDHWLN